MRVEIVLQLQPECTFGTAQSLEPSSDSRRDVQFTIAEFLQVGFADLECFAGFGLAHIQSSEFIGDGETWMNDSSGQCVVLVNGHGSSLGGILNSVNFFQCSRIQLKSIV
jgi:hypothetical protein